MSKPVQTNVFSSCIFRIVRENKELLYFYPKFSFLGFVGQICPSLAGLGLMFIFESRLRLVSINFAACTVVLRIYIEGWLGIMILPRIGPLILLCDMYHNYSDGYWQQNHF